MPTILKNKIIFNSQDWLWGLDPQSGIGAPMIFGGLDTALYFDPFRYLGYASPGFLPEDVANVSKVTTMLRAGCVSSDSKGYAVGGALLHQITPSSGAITDNTDFPHTIAGTGVIAYDVVEYNVSGTKKIFYSWRDNTDGDVGTYDLGSTFDDDFMSTTPTDAAALGNTHTMPMIVGADDNLYIGDGNVLHQYIGSTNTLVANKLTLGQNWHIKSFAIYEQLDYLVIFADREGSSPTGVAYQECRAFFWNYVTTSSYAFSAKIEGTQLGGAFQDFAGTFGAITYGLSPDSGSNTRRIHINAWTGSRFKRLMSIPTSDLPIHGGIEVVGNMLFMNCGGKLYSYGAPFPGMKAGLHHLASGSGSGNGMLKSFTSDRRLMSSGATTAGGCEIIYQNYQSGASVFTSFAVPIFASGKQGQVESAQIYFGKTSTGGRDLDVSLVGRDGTTIQLTSHLKTISSGKLIVDRKIPNANRAFSAIQASLLWNTGDGETDAPIVDKIVVDFSQINI